MDQLQGKHHKGRITENDSRLIMKRRQERLLKEDISEEDYYITRSGQFQCRFCLNVSPFSSLKMLSVSDFELLQRKVHLHGKKHKEKKDRALLRAEESHEKKKSELSEEISFPFLHEGNSSLPSLLERTKRVTDSVINSVCPQIPTLESVVPSTIAPPQPLQAPQAPLLRIPGPTDLPLWRQKMLQEKEDERMYANGYRKNDEGEWYRDESVEFDSDEETV